MQRLLAIARTIDAVNARIGRWASWLIVAAILVSAVNAIVRKVFDSSSNAWLEVQWYLFGAAFMLCTSWTLQRREHIRIDLLVSQFPRRVRHWLELVGHIVFLLPFTLLMIWLTWAILGRSVVNSGHDWDAAGGLLGQVVLVLSRIVGDTAALLTGGQAQWEYSGNPGGLVMWPAYAFILLGFVALTAQGISETIKHVAVMRGLLPEPSAGGHGHQPEAEA